MDNGARIDAQFEHLTKLQAQLEAVNTRIMTIWGPFCAAFLILAVLDDEYGKYWLLGYVPAALNYWGETLLLRKEIKRVDAELDD